MMLSYSPARPLTKGVEALLQKWGCAQDLADAVGGLPRAGGSASSGRHLHACRRACLALKLHRILAPMLQVRGKACHTTVVC